jgi:hypothetical protein
MQISPLDGCLVSALSMPIAQWGEWLNSSADFNPNHNRNNADPKQTSVQTTSRPHHHATPKQNTEINKKSGIGHHILSNTNKIPL